MKKLRAVFGIAVLLLVLFAAVSCAGKEKQIIGTWTSVDSVITVGYSFKDDGTGTKSAFGATVDTKYAFSNDTLYVTYSLLGVDTTETFTVSFDDNGHLILTDVDGSTDEFVKN